MVKHVGNAFILVELFSTLLPTFPLPYHREDAVRYLIVSGLQPVYINTLHIQSAGHTHTQRRKIIVTRHRFSKTLSNETRGNLLLDNSVVAKSLLATYG